MASSSTHIVANLGTQTIGVAKFTTTPSGGLILESYQLAEILGDPAADSTRVAQTRLAISEVVEALKIKGQPITYALPGQSVFARFVKLPPVAEDKVEQIITFEAQQNVPFPLSEVVWDYQLLSDLKSSSQIEVLLVAIKADGLDEINEAVQSCGLKTQMVDVSPAALYNAFRYNYSDLTGCTLLVDLGSRTTNLIFAEGTKLFSRSIPIGGAAITQAIAKELNEPFIAAEEFKRKAGYVGLGGAYAEPSDPTVAQCSKIIRNSMTRIHADIARSISFYRSQQGGSQPTRVLLCGGSSALPYMREFFSEKLQMPIDYFNPLRNVAVGKGIDVDKVVKDAHQLGEAVGMALRGLGACPLEFNLRPQSVVREQALAAQKPFLIAAAALILGVLGALYLYFDRAASTKEDVVEQVEQRVASLSALETQMNQVVREQKTLETVASQYLRATSERDVWLRILDEMARALPADYIWLTELTPMVNGQPLALGGTPVAEAPRQQSTGGPGGQRGEPSVPAINSLRLEGMYLYNTGRKEQIVNDFVEALAKSPLFAIDLSKPNEVLPKLAAQNNREWAFPFEIRIQLKEPIALK
ncbi:MAG: Amuc_1101 family PilM-like pilus complex protein [Verrucomicrobiia bacterium]